MTIRYTCTGCASVLKIKDEKAGTKGKCPKCKLEFLVPNPELENDESEIEAASQTDDDLEESVDMPIELTPDVSEPDDFDPMAVLGGTSGKGAKKSGLANPPGPLTADRKPSVAELMKDFEATRKKNRDDKSAPEVSRPTAASAVETSGSAASALTRAYEKKRESASAPSVSAKEAKSAEEQQLLVDFIKRRALPGVAAILVVLYGWYWWMNKETYEGPPLFEVAGQVLRSGQPVQGVQIFFEPVRSMAGEDNRPLAMAFSGPDGNYRVMYSASFPGAAAGQYRIGLRDETGIPVALPEEMVITVQENDSNNFKISY